MTQQIIFKILTAELRLPKISLKSTRVQLERNRKTSLTRKLRLLKQKLEKGCLNVFKPSEVNSKLPINLKNLFMKSFSNQTHRFLYSGSNQKMEM